MNFEKPKMKICYFGIYDPSYSRNRVLIKGLEKNNIEVLQCCVNPSEKYKYIKLFKKHKKIKNYDLMIVGFPGHPVVPLAKLICRKKIVFDALVSLYDSNILNRKTYSLYSFASLKYLFLDWLSCRLADKILLDTNEHIEYFIKTFRITRKKFKKIYIGSDNSIFFSKNNKRDNIFLIHFHGAYTPLHGVEYIIMAAKLLERENIQFNLIGRGQTFAEIMELSKKLEIKNINFINSVTMAGLAEYMARADICLGIFGKSAKTNRVIPNKAYEAIAMRKPLITANTPAARELFENKKHVLLCARADSRDLADKILELKNNPKLRIKVANNGYNLYKEKLLPKILGLELKKFLLDLVNVAKF